MATEHGVESQFQFHVVPESMTGTGDGDPALQRNADGAVAVGVAVATPQTPAAAAMHTPHEESSIPTVLAGKAFIPQLQSK